MTARAQVWPRPSADGRRLRRRIAPIAFSIAVHGALLASIASQRFHEIERPAPPRELIVDTVIAEPSGPITIPDLPPRPAAPAPMVAAAPLDVKRGAGPPAQANNGSAGGDFPNTTSGGPPGGQSDGAMGRFFGLPARAKQIVFVIDRSGSMETDDAFELAKRELLGSLQRLPNGSRFAVVVYNERPHLLATDARGLAEPTRANIARIQKQLDSLAPIGGTNHLEALRRALASRPEAIFWLTDADDLSRGLADAIARLLTSKRGPRPTLSVVQLRRPGYVQESPALLPSLCKQCGGDSTIVDLGDPRQPAYRAN